MSPATVKAATEHLEAADRVAEQQGDGDADYTSFGPTNVGLHEVDVLLRLDNAWSALEAADRIDPTALAALGRERRARHLLTTARAQLLSRRHADAGRTLLEAERLAPEEVRRPWSVALVQDLLDRTPSPAWELRELAQRCGLRT